MFKPTPTLLCDFYKISHRKQYPEGTTLVYSNLTPRSGKYYKGKSNKVMFFGLQYFIKHVLVDLFNEQFFNRDKEEVIVEYARVIKHCLGDNNPDTSHIEQLHDLGYLPLQIKALPELSLVDYQVPVLTVRNTHPDFYWLTNFIETVMSSDLWLMSNNATLAYDYRMICEEWADKTCDNNDHVPFQCHDFSFRGMAGHEAATMSGMAHLTQFKGTDTIPAIQAMEYYYGKNIETELIGTSIPASEHAVMCAGGKESEFETYKRFITELYPNGFVSIVSDTWDFFGVLTDILPKLKSEIMARDGKTVIRPDCYSEDTSILTPHGWKLFKDLAKDDLVAQVKEDGTYEFVNILKYVEQDYEGDMYHFKDHHGKLDFIVTPNHRMIFNHNGKIKVEEAEHTKIGGWGKNILRSAKAIDKNKSLTPIEKLKIAFQADGAYVTRMTTSIRFNLFKKRKIVRLLCILDDANLEYKVYDLADGSVEVNVKVDASEFRKDFSWVDISSLCSNWCAEFIEELSYWDATRRSDSRFKFDTAVKEVIDVVELIAISAGYGCLISKTEDNRKDIFSDIYTAHIMKSNSIGGQSQTKEKIHYKGKIYCVQVPTGMLLVKRNRSVIVCGNSGNPVDIICGGIHVLINNETIVDEYYPDTPEGKGAIELLWDTFGGTINSKGYKVLDPHIGLIYGDSITHERAEQIFQRLEDKGFASSNVVFGVGSFSYQYHTRDSQGWAVKATYCEVNGEGRAIFKQPKTDAGKTSARGLLRVDKTDTGYRLTDNCTWEQESEGELQTVFLNGK